MNVFQLRVTWKSLRFRSGRVGMFTVTPLSRMIRSTLKKKCALSLTIGPPIVPPYCCCVRRRLLEILLLGEVVLRAEVLVLEEREPAAVKARWCPASTRR